MRPSFHTALCLSAALSLGLGGVAVAAAAKKPAAPAKPVAGAPAWTVDKANSKIRFKSAFSGMGFEGGFGRWDAQINFDPNNLPASKAVISVELASVASGDADRDETLPSADWFNVARFPRAVFTTTAITAAGPGKYNAAGTLSLRGVTKPIVLPFTLVITGDTARMTGQVVLNRSNFGVGQGQFRTPDTVPYEVTVPVTVVAKRAG
ncbi:MAG TPA: YceI family protein [Caulobacteraceae bacterium]|jgi:polyisoprenoid-binding protein YceI|nr:YceI family protein [Caulobacteraceae bacterium]